MSPLKNTGLKKSSTELELVQDANLFDDSFKVLATIGRGHKSIVYQALKMSSSSEAKPYEVALKVLTCSSKNPEIIKRRMKREAVSLLTARHENIIRMFDFVSSKDHCYLSMEYAAGGDLFKLIESRSEGLDPIKALSLIVQALKGLEVVHDAGIIHRDIKPENLLLTEKGVLKIADFGIPLIPEELIKIEDEGAKGSGTFDYLAPELLENGDCSFASDIYALGVTLFQLMTKVLPFEDISFARSLERKISDNRPELKELLPDAHPALSKLIDKALSPKPENRFSSAKEFRLEAEKILLELNQSETRKVSVKNLRSEITLSTTKTQSTVSSDFSNEDVSEICYKTPRTKKPFLQESKEKLFERLKTFKAD